VIGEEGRGGMFWKGNNKKKSRSEVNEDGQDEVAQRTGTRNKERERRRMKEDEDRQTRHASSHTHQHTWG